MRAIIMSSALIMILGSCAPNNKPESEQESIKTEKPVESYPSEMKEGMDTLYIRGEAVVFFMPNENEAAQNKSTQERKELIARFNEVKPELEVAGYHVFLTDKTWINIQSSDSSSVFFDRRSKGIPVGTICLKKNEGPYFLEGVWAKSEYQSRIDQYFNK